MDMKILCECGGLDCEMKIDLPHEENVKAHQNGGVIIVKGCSQGPFPTDILVEEKDKYSIYREG